MEQGERATRPWPPPSWPTTCPARAVVLAPVPGAPARFNQPLVAVIIGGLTTAAGVGLVLSRDHREASLTTWAVTTGVPKSTIEPARDRNGCSSPVTSFTTFLRLARVEARRRRTRRRGKRHPCQNWPAGELEGPTYADMSSCISRTFFAMTAMDTPSSSLGLNWTNSVPASAAGAWPGAI